MERRDSQRRQTATKVYLSDESLPLTACTTRDMSSGGVFVETSDARWLRRGMRVQLTFVVELDGVDKLHQCSAIVARTTKDGVGLAFESGSAVMGILERYNAQSSGSGNDEVSPPCKVLLWPVTTDDSETPDPTRNPKVAD